jgi:ABC-type molybdenum transport system ATPase subunit/photorepair protein PhrA
MTVLAACKVLKGLINQIPWHKITQLHPAIVGENTGTGKTLRKVVNGALFTSSSIHCHSLCKAFLQKPAFYLVFNPIFLIF